MMINYHEYGIRIYEIVKKLFPNDVKYIDADVLELELSKTIVKILEKHDEEVEDLDTIEKIKAYCAKWGEGSVRMILEKFPKEEMEYFIDLLKKLNLYLQ